MNYNSLKSDIAAVVKQNGNQEITGENLQGVLTEMIDNSVGTGYLYKGIATPETQGGTPDQNVFYLAGAGTYANFGTTITIPDGTFGIFKYGGVWEKSIIQVDAKADNKSYISIRLSKFISSANGKIANAPNDNYVVVVFGVISNKKYIIKATESITTTSLYSSFCEDINGQVVVQQNGQLQNGYNIYTAPNGANYLTLCVNFNGNNTGVWEDDITVMSYNEYVNEGKVNEITDIQVFCSKVEKIFIENLFSKQYQNGLVNTGGAIITTLDGFCSSLIPVKANTFYYLQRKDDANVNVRCITSILSPVKPLAVNGNEPSIFALPNADATGYVASGAFLTPANAAYFQFNLTPNNVTAISNYNECILQEIGEVYNPNFTPNQNLLSKPLIVKDNCLEYPVNKKNIKVLLIGSSHGMNTIGQFPILSYHAGIDVVCANAYQGSLSLQQIYEYCISGNTFAGWYKKFHNGEWHDSQSMTIAQMLLDEEWDVISIQRSASEDMTWTETQDGYFEGILNYITTTCEYCPKIVFNSGFADTYSIDTRSQQQEDTQQIWATATQVHTKYGVDIIPMATILQECRNNDTLANIGSSPNKMLSCDTQHLDQGIGMYVSGCVCFNFFLKKFDINILSNAYIPTIADITPFWYDAAKYTAVTQENARLIRRIVNSYNQ